MTGVLVTALSLAGIGLIVLGERMGLPVATASSGVMLVIALAVLVLGFSTTTSRLGGFAAGKPAGGAIAFTAMMAVTLLSSIGGFQPLHVNTILAGAVGVLSGLLLVPLSPWRHFGADDAATSGDRDPATGTSGALDIAGLAGSFAALIVAFRLAPTVFDLMASTTQQSRQNAVLLVLCLCLVPVVFGGARAQGRLALLFLSLCLVLLVLPVALRIPLPAGGHDLAGTRDKIVLVLGEVTRGTSQIHFSRHDLMVAATGFATGFALLPAAAPVRHGAKRLAAFAASAVLVAAITASFSTTGLHLEAVVDTRIRALSPAQWPLFVFEDGVRGWISACGRVSEDAFAAAQACGSVTARAPLPAGAIQFNPIFVPQASASALGLPVVFGAIWALLPGIAGALTLGILLHAAIGCLVDRILFRQLNPRAPRAWRLAMMRLGIILAVIGLYWVERFAFRGDQRLLDWALLALCSTMLTALVAFGFVRIARWFRSHPAMPEIQLPAETKA